MNVRSFHRVTGTSICRALNCALDRVGVTFPRNLQQGHLLKQLVGVHTGDAGDLRRKVDRTVGQFMARLADLRPVVSLLKLDRLGHGQVGGRVVRAQPLMIVEKVRSALELPPLRPPPPADDQRFNQVLHLAASVQKRRALRRAEPLVACGHIEIRPDRPHVDADLPRPVRPVNDRHNALFASPATNLVDRNRHRRRRRDMAEEQDLRPLGHTPARTAQQSPRPT